MAQLRFRNAQLRTLLQYAANCKTFNLSYESQIDAYQKKTRKRYNFENQMPEEFTFTTVPTIMLVKDHGVYLMIHSKEIEIKQGENNPSVVYAEGYDPKARGYTYEKCHAVSGDDFAMDFRLSDLTEPIEKGCDLIFSVTSKEIRIQSIVPTQLKADKVN